MLEFAGIAVRLRHRAKRSELGERNERRLAIERLIELVGEAAKRVSSHGREEMTHIPWPQITGMREKLTHDYDGIDPDLLWETLRNDLRSLIRQLQAVLSGRDR
jgi:uncharacterized protein with HEPN domain